jgi:hypothetical protein
MQSSPYIKTIIKYIFIYLFIFIHLLHFLSNLIRFLYQALFFKLLSKYAEDEINQFEQQYLVMKHQQRTLVSKDLVKI